MGQIYTVAARFKFNNSGDREAARLALVEYIKQQLEDGTHFDTIEDGSKQTGLFDSFEGVMNIILSNQKFSYDRETGTFDSNFKATYSWHSILETCFKKICLFLSPDSYMAVSPDHGFYLYKPQGDTYSEHSIINDTNPYIDDTVYLLSLLDDEDLYNALKHVYIRKVNDSIFVMELSEDEAKQCINESYESGLPWCEVVTFLPKNMKKYDRKAFEEYYFNSSLSSRESSCEWYPAEPLTKVLLEGVA